MLVNERPANATGLQAFLQEACHAISVSTGPACGAKRTNCVCCGAAHAPRCGSAMQVHTIAAHARTTRQLTGMGLA